MRHLSREIDVVRTRFERAQELIEGFPIPFQTLGQNDAGDVFDAFHQADEHVVVVWPARREADATVAHHHGRDAMPRRRRQARVPGRLAIVVRMNVDEAGRDDHALGVDLVAARIGNLADGGDLTVVDRDVALDRL